MRIPPLRIIGHGLIFGAVIALLVVNATLLYGTQNKVSEEKEAAEEALKPAEIQLTILSVSDCPDCFDINSLVGPLKSNSKIKITKEDNFAYSSEEGATVIKKYGIARVPTVIVQGQTSKVFNAESFLRNLGKQAEDGALVVTNVPPVYVEVASGAVKGKFTATYLTDKNCKECYDVALHRRALAGLAMKPTAEQFVDRLDVNGEALISKYKIESAPTIVLTGELELYPQLQQVWPSVGTTEKDGTHVFRAGQQLMGAYRDLKTGKVVKPEPPEPAPAPAPSPAQTPK